MIVVEQRPRVVLVNFHSMADVRRRVRSDALAGCDVIVVDNASDPDEVAELCRDTGARALLLPTNAGFAAGVNAAVGSVPYADRPWLLLNPDVELTRDAMDSLIGELTTTPADGVTPLLREPSGRLQVGVAGGPITLRSVASYFLFLSHLFRFTGIMFTRQQSLRRREASWLCMACLLLRADAFDRFGPIPEDEIVYAEDVAWGTHASRRGARFRLLSDVEVVHAVGASGGSADWSGALGRLCRRRLGAVRGSCAVLAMRIGLGVRRALGRSVP
jgi:GT2 family glycosyltransferase